MDTIITFDYAALGGETAGFVQQRTGEIRALMRRTAHDIIEIGLKLIDVKARLGHGHFLAWLNAEFGWHRDTANKFMHVAEQFANTEMSEISTFAPSALYVLAAPVAPEAARAEALARAAAGEPISHALAREIVARHRDGQFLPQSPAIPDTGEPGQPGGLIWRAGDGEHEFDIITSSEACPEDRARQPVAANGLVPVALLEQGVRQWLADRQTPAPDPVRCLTEIVARTTAGLADFNTLLASGALAQPYRNRDVLVACRNVLDRLRGALPEGELASAPGLALLAPAATGAAVTQDEPAPAVTGAVVSSTAVPPIAAPDFDPCDLGPVRIWQADARELPALVAPEPVHLVITSPPYNVGIDYGVYDDTLSEEAHLHLLKEVFAGCQEVMAEGARIAVVAPAGIGRNPWRPLASLVAGLLVDVGLVLRGQIIWDKGTSGNRTSWGSFRLPTDPSLRDTTETVVVAHKGSSRLAVPADCLRRDAAGPYSPLMPDPDTFMTLAQDHWTIPPESATQIGHPAPFPVGLAERLIRFYAYPGAHILDPFAGSGTVGVAAIRLGCRATLVDIDAAYCALAWKRCRDALSSQ